MAQGAPPIPKPKGRGLLSTDRIDSPMVGTPSLMSESLGLLPTPHRATQAVAEPIAEATLLPSLGGMLSRGGPPPSPTLEQQPSLELFSAPSQQAPRGRLFEGNINLHNRPEVHNPDGSISTVRSVSFGYRPSALIEILNLPPQDIGRLGEVVEVLIPSVSDDGRIMNDAEAKRVFEATGKHLGIFVTPAQATVYAKQLTQDYDVGLIPLGGPLHRIYGSPAGR